MLKQIRKLLAVGSSILLMATMLSLPSVSAVSYNYDINGDGQVGLADAVFLKKYLNGRCDVTNQTVLDVTQDGIIDMVDYDCIIAFLMGSDFSIL